MQTPGEIPMNVLMTKRFLATKSRASKPCLSIRELAGTRFASVPVMPGNTGWRNRGQNLLSFHVLSWPISRSPAWAAASDKERKSQTIPMVYNEVVERDLTPKRTRLFIPPLGDNVEAVSSKLSPPRLPRQRHGYPIEHT
jgi:hypothetical protein